MELTQEDKERRIEIAKLKMTFEIEGVKHRIIDLFRYPDSWEDVHIVDENEVETIFHKFSITHWDRKYEGEVIEVQKLEYVGRLVES